MEKYEPLSCKAWLHIFFYETFPDVFPTTKKCHFPEVPFQREKGKEQRHLLGDITKVTQLVGGGTRIVIQVWPSPKL